ncbi:hypothetical protein HY024_03740, partial [Candidatus Curtissbacteria bacterium]|nr:hypothetical protein [Candidatus Curtissbacteria bacterium]
MEEPKVFTRNYQPPPPLKERLATWLKIAQQKVTPIVKSTKFKTITALCGSFLLILVAFIAIAGTKKPPEDTLPPVIVQEKQSPTPTLSAMSQKVADFENRLDQQEGFQKKL